MKRINILENKSYERYQENWLWTMKNTLYYLGYNINEFRYYYL
mgnify:CR=1 FL=1